MFDIPSLIIVLASLLMAGLTYDKEEAKSKEENKNNSYPLAFFLFAVFIAIVQIGDNYVKKQSRKISNANTKKHYIKTDTIDVKLDTVGKVVFSVDSTIRKHYDTVLQKLVIIDSTASKYVTQMEEYLAFQKKIARENRPDIEFISGDFMWETVDSSNFTLKIFYRNSGGRIASNIKIESFLFPFGSFNNDESMMLTKNPYHLLNLQSENLQPYNLSGYSVSTYFPELPKQKLKEMFMGVILIRVSFNDRFENRYKTKTISVVYRKDLTGTKFRDGSPTGTELAIEWLKNSDYSFQF